MPSRRARERRTKTPAGGESRREGKAAVAGSPTLQVLLRRGDRARTQGHLGTTKDYAGPVALSRGRHRPDHRTPGLQLPEGRSSSTSGSSTTIRTPRRCRGYLTRYVPEWPRIDLARCPRPGRRGRHRAQREITHVVDNGIGHGYVLIGWPGVTEPPTRYAACEWPTTRLQMAISRVWPCRVFDTRAGGTSRPRGPRCRIRARTTSASRATAAFRTARPRQSSTRPSSGRRSSATCDSFRRADRSPWYRL